MENPSGHTRKPDVADVPTPQHASSALTMDALLRVLQRLPPNEVACTARLLCTETARRLSAPQHRTVRLSQPIPPHAVSWRCGEEALRQLSFRGKLGVLSTAAASGCEANLEVAWRLVSPSLFPDIPPDADLDIHRPYTRCHDPGPAAARAGHAHLLPWLLEHGCPLDSHHTLEAVAEHCDLAALQRAWALLEPRIPALPGVGSERGDSGRSIAGCAARSRTPDAASKLRWLVEEKGHPCGQDEVTAAAQGGSIDCLHWLQRWGCDVAAPLVLCMALEQASMEVVRWAWEQSPQREGAFTRCVRRNAVLYASCSGVEGVAKLRWLQELGAAFGPDERRAALAWAACNQQLGTVRYLVEECGVVVEQGEGELAEDMALGCDLEVMRYLLQKGAARHPEAYCRPALAGDLGLLRWLVSEGFPFKGTATVRAVIESWPVRGAPGSGARVEEDCLAAVQAVVAAGAALGDDAVAAAAQRGSLPLVRWLVEECGCAVPADALARAAGAGCAELLEWLVARGCPPDPRVGREYVLPAHHGDLHTLQQLRQLGVPWGPGAFAPGDLLPCTVPVLRWLVHNGMELDRGAARDAALLSADSDTKQWLEAYTQAE